MPIVVWGAAGCFSAASSSASWLLCNITAVRELFLLGTESERCWDGDIAGKEILRSNGVLLDSVSFSLLSLAELSEASFPFTEYSCSICARNKSANPGFSFSTLWSCLFNFWVLEINSLWSFDKRSWFCSFVIETLKTLLYVVVLELILIRSLVLYIQTPITCFPNHHQSSRLQQDCLNTFLWLCFDEILTYLCWTVCLHCS